ncbi:MAG: CPBP family intramembrane metalloprotease, partial [Candidatus Omnitrophica bacterium]|nr:CPBP family intramembrane metalloprotease [Candidatus Omnitrophota bacterium]
AVGEGFKNFIPSLMHTEIKFVTFGILISFLSAASEEMAFSGFAYPAFRKKYGILLGLLITASVFWFMHFQLGFPKFFIVNFATHFIPGICYAYLYEKRRSLITPITAHFISNILAKII